MNSSQLRRILDPAPFTAAEARALLGSLLAEGTTDVERAGVLIGLAGRELTVGELVAFALEMRRRARRFPLPARDRAIDLCGSGGAPRPSYNVSTVSAFVVAASGVSVVKHGNRSARGPCGSSDLLEALGLPVTSSLSFGRASYRAHRIAFLHAPLYHPTARAVAPVRRALGVPTLFNRLGPLSNPARVRFQVVGMADRPGAELASRVLPHLGVVRGLSMSSADGCDEFSPRAATTAFVWHRRRRSRREFRPSDHLPPDDRQGEWGPLPPPEAAVEAERILAGGGGARRGSVLLTSAAALWISGGAPSFRHGLERARTTLDSGRAERLLRQLQRLARRYRAPEGR